MSHTTDIHLAPHAPYDFDLSLGILARGDPQVARYEDGHYRRVVRLGTQLVQVDVRSEGTVETPGLVGRARSVELLSRGERRSLHDALCRLLNLDLDLKPFYEHVKGDKVLGAVIQRLRGLLPPGAGSVFEALVSAIIEQQISLAASRQMEYRMTKRYGDKLVLDDDVMYAFPSPQALGDAPIEGLQECGLSRRKAEYIRGIASLVSTGQLDLDGLRNKANEEAIAELLKLRGIGMWTAEYVLIRGLGRLNAIPADDIALQRDISHYYANGAKMSAGEVRSLAEEWGEWRGLAGFYILTAARLHIEL